MTINTFKDRDGGTLNASQVPNRQALDSWLMEERGGMRLADIWWAPMQELFMELEWSLWDIPTKKLEGEELEKFKENWFGIFRAAKNIRTQFTGEVTSDIHIVKNVAWAMQPTSNERVLAQTKKMPSGMDWTVRRPGRVTLAITQGSLG